MLVRSLFRLSGRPAAQSLTHTTQVFTKPVQLCWLCVRAFVIQIEPEPPECGWGEVISFFDFSSFGSAITGDAPLNFSSLFECGWGARHCMLLISHLDLMSKIWPPSPRSTISVFDFNTFLRIYPIVACYMVTIPTLIRQLCVRAFVIQIERPVCS